MDYKVICEPGFSLVEVELQAGESIVSDAGAMAWMSDNLRAQTSMRGGLGASLKRSLLGGESFFQNTYSADGGPGMIGLAPGCAGAIVPYRLDNDELLLQKSAYLASETGVACDSKWQGFKGLFNVGVFALRVTGTGMLFFSAYGCIHEITVDGEYVIDNGYVVAWEPALTYTITRARKVRSFIFSDQLLLRFAGRGRVWVQTRSPYTLASWVYPFRPQKAKSNND